ncbi:MAG: DUF4276 family protein [Chloroflexi bacterium]|nr:DUF4276 family protein [Chloroflexota bacterium]
MRVLLLVEGLSDKYVLPILARKMLPGNAGIDVRVVSQGDMVTNARKVHAHIRAARRRDTVKVILCRDSEGIPAAETKPKLEVVAQEVARSFRSLPIEAVVVDHSLEGWLLHDREAIARYLGIPPAGLRYRNPEDDLRPARRMENIFRRARRDFTKTGDGPRRAGRSGAHRREQPDVPRVPAGARGPLDSLAPRPRAGEQRGEPRDLIEEGGHLLGLPQMGPTPLG